MLKKGAFLFLFLIFNLPVFSQFDYTDDCKKAYGLIIDLRFDSAQKYIEKVKRDDPENLVPQILENYIDFFSIVLTEDEKRFEELRSKKKTRVNQWEKGSEDSPYYRMGIAQINMQWAFVRVLFGEYFTAAFEINQAYHLLEENKELYPDFLPNVMGLGILHAMIGVVPDQYQWAVNFLGLYGSIDQGLGELEALLNSDQPEFQHFKAETLFLYTFLKLNLQSEEKRYTELKVQYQKAEMDLVSQRSPLLHFSRAVLLMKENNDSVIPFLETRPVVEDAAVFYYPEFMLGQAKLFKLDNDAQQLFDNYIDLYPGNNFKRSAAQKKAWSAFVQGDTLGYKKSMTTMLAFPSTQLDGDDAALKEAKKASNGYLPNVYLLKSRILFDGGYLKEALQVFEKADSSKFNKDEKIELSYRKARIYHHLDSLDQALTFYQLALNEGEEHGSYFAANSCLKMGEIYAKKNKNTQAEMYFEKCLDLDFDEYRRSIRAKAKAGLQGIKSN
jgi:tetratricopeptide (TPR) repeat protein